MVNQKFWPRNHWLKNLLKETRETLKKISFATLSAVVVESGVGLFFLMFALWCLIIFNTILTVTWYWIPHKTIMSACYGCMKYGVIYVALLFMVTGAAIVALSAYFLLEQDIYLEVAPEDEYLVYGRWFLIVAGSVMLIGGITGCLGGFKQSSSLLSAFFSIVLIISLAELAAGVYIYLNQDDFVKYFRTQMKNSVQNFYGVDEYRTRGWDLMQKSMQCCGATGFRDYSSNVLQRPETQGIIDMRLSANSGSSYMVPKSCCHDIPEAQCEISRSISITASIPGIGDVLASSSIYKEGCAERFIEWIKSKSPYFVGALIGIGTVQILCLLFTCILICAYRSRRSSYKN